MHVPTRSTDPGIRPRWFKRPECSLEALDPALGVTEAVLEQVWRSPRGESDFVTVVDPGAVREGIARPAGAAPRTSSPSSSACSPSRASSSRTSRPVTEPDTRRPRSSSLVSSSPVSMRRRCARSTTRARSASPTCAPSTSPLKPRRRAGSAGMGPPRPSRAARGRRGAVPRHRRAAPRLPAGAHRGGRTEVLVLMPELVVRGWRRLLHNQRALYVKRLLLFEPLVSRRGAVPAPPIEIRSGD